MFTKHYFLLLILSLSILSSETTAATSSEPYNWSGFYTGVNMSYGWGSNTKVLITVNEPPNTGIGDYLGFGNNVYPNLTPQGLLGGVQLGLDKQLGAWIIGAITDFQATNIRAAASGYAVGIIPGAVVPSVQSLSQHLDFLGTLRGRTGWSVDNWLFYGTAGLGYAQVNSTINFDLSPYANHPAIFQAGSNTQFLMGWVAGGGVNYGLENWVLGIEYLHYDLGHASVSTSPYITNGGAAIINAQQNVTGDVIRALFNYRF
jgi:outer membrane immunogenic protein